MKPIAIRRRSASGGAEWPTGLHPLLARVYAARGLLASEVVPRRLVNLVRPRALGGLDRACVLIADAIARDRRICVVGDFDADGATGTAVAMRGLRLLGARNVCYRVPNRLRDGYGLSVGLVESMADIAPDLIVTVDNGIASHAGVAAARARGMCVVITDHHLPGESLPAADAIVNPNAVSVEECEHGRPICDACARDARTTTSLAGVGVIFYLLLALRARLYPGGPPDGEEKEAAVGGRSSRSVRPDLAPLLDLVALGTVADLVPLDGNNRILVEAGLRRIRAGQAGAGIAALFKASGRDPARAVASDLGFALGPRINAAGRLDDMGLGIECLLSDEPGHALLLADRLSVINTERQELQATMVEQGEAMLARFVERYRDEALPYGICLHEADWHQGVVGLVASKLKERLNRPVVAFASVEASAPENASPDSGAGARASSELRGSARSVSGFHLRDALAEIDALCPGLITRFGGHAMAAGLSLPAANLARFAAEFDAVARRRLDAEQLESCIWSDGELHATEFSAEAARALRYAAPWGQGFPEPLFDNVFVVESWRAVGERHLRMQLRLDGSQTMVEAILFNAAERMPPPTRLRAVFQLDLNEWNGRERLQLLVRHIEPA